MFIRIFFLRSVRYLGDDKILVYSWKENGNFCFVILDIFYVYIGGDYCFVVLSDILGIFGWLGLRIVVIVKVMVLWGVCDEIVR